MDSSDLDSVLFRAFTETVKSAAVLMTWQAQRCHVNLKPALWSHWNWAAWMTHCPHDGTYVPGNHRYGCLASFCLSQAVYDNMLLSGGQEDGGGVTSCPDSCQLDPSGIYWDIFLNLFVADQQCPREVPSASVAAFSASQNHLVQIRSSWQEHILLYLFSLYSKSEHLWG